MSDPQFCLRLGRLHRCRRPGHRQFPLGLQAGLRCLCPGERVAYRLETYVPDSQYPRMMLTISALNLLIAGAFLVIGARRLHRRDL